MRGSAVQYWLLLAVVLGIGYGGSLAWRQYRVSAETQPETKEVVRPLKPFAITDQHGKPFHSDQWRGKVWVVGFFFTSCPSECPRLTRAMAELQAA